MPIEAGDPEDVLKSLEDGRIDVGEALRRLDPEPDEAEPLPRPRFWRLWWAICFGSGIGLAVIAAGVATLGGWWWLAAAPAGLVALILMALGILSADAPWLQLHVATGSAGWPREIRLGLPLPLRPAAWVLRHWPGRAAALDGTALDELILTLEENLKGGDPMVIDVHEGRSGERVRLHIG
jgi:hypothetical protein